MTSNTKLCEVSDYYHAVFYTSPRDSYSMYKQYHLCKLGYLFPVNLGSFPSVFFLLSNIIGIFAPRQLNYNFFWILSFSAVIIFHFPRVNIHTNFVKNF